MVDDTMFFNDLLERFTNITGVKNVLIKAIGRLFNEMNIVSTCIRKKDSVGRRFRTRVIVIKELIMLSANSQIMRIGNHEKLHK